MIDDIKFSELKICIMPCVRGDLFRQGLQAFKDHQYETACEFLLKATEEDQQNHKAWNALGVVLSKIDDTAQAIICFENALSLDPCNEIYQKNFGKISTKNVQKTGDTGAKTSSVKECGKNPYLLASQYPLSAPQLSPLGNPDPECPSCGGRLEQFPTQKIQCPACKSSIYQKLRPYDQRPVLLNENQAIMIESEWEIFRNYSFTRDLIQGYFPKNNKPTYQDMVAELEKKSGVFPSVFDVLWKANSKKSIEHMKEGHFLLLRNDILKFASLADQVGKTTLALQQYLGVLFLDVNGPKNDAVMKNGTWIQIPFDSSAGGVTPEILSKVCGIIDTHKYSRRFVKGEFLKGSDSMQQKMGAFLPYSQTPAWGIITLEIEKCVKYEGYSRNDLTDPASMIW